jgi:hypothetical protein
VQQDTQLATLLKASQAAQLRGVLEHARALAQVQTEAASAQAEAARSQAAVARLEAAQASAAIGHARELAQVQAAVAALRGELRGRDAEIAELKRGGRVQGSAADGGGGAGAGASGACAGGGGSAGGLTQLHASHQALRQVKQEKADVGEQLADKDELFSEAVLSEDSRTDTIDRLKARLREAGVGEHEIAGLVCTGTYA